MTELQKQLLEFLAAGTASATYLARQSNAANGKVYEALVQLEAWGAVRVIVPRNSKPKWALVSGF